MTTQSRSYRTDIGVLRPVQRRDDGTIVVDAFFTKCGVFTYVQPDGSIQKELRLPEDVFDSQSLVTAEGIPVTLDHPPGMVSAANAKKYVVGAVIGTPIRDADHLRGRFAVYDADAVGAMESGKTQVSCGYQCSTVNEPGIHPMYGPYDSVQKDIRFNHLAIVDRARAGITASARMDSDIANGMMVLQPGTQVAVDIDPEVRHAPCMATVPTARVEVIVKHDAGEPSASAKVDPDDLASRNAAGKTSAKAGSKEQPGSSYEDDGSDRAKPRKGADPDDDEDADDDSDDDDDEDTDDSAMYDGDGKLTDQGKSKVASATFAVPGKSQLPMHDAQAVKDSMKSFAKHEFDDADAKHGAFNRLKNKACAFGMQDDADRFEKKFGGKLDRADGANKDNAMSTVDLKTIQDKSDARKAKLVKARARVDALEAELAAAQGAITNLTKELETAKAPGAHADAADSTFQTRVDAQVALLEVARGTGAAVDAKMSARAIKVAVIKHVDGDDVAADAHEKYVDGVYDGALKRAKKDGAATAKGSAALAATLAAVNGAGATHLDGGTDEDAAKAALAAASRQMINQPSAGREQLARKVR